jgi:signal transduction histidine kinase
LALELATTLRRENPILSPFLDQLRELTDYMDAGIYRVEAHCFTLLTYRGPIPQTQALSLSWPKQALGDWVRAIEAGNPIINAADDGTLAEIATLQSPMKTLVSLPPDITPSSLLAVPIVGKTGSTYLLAVGSGKPDSFTPELADQIRDFTQAHLRTIETGARHAELAQRAVEAEILLSVQRSISGQLDPRAVLRLIADEARNVTFSRNACIHVLEEDELVLEAFSGERSAVLPECERWPLDGAAIDEIDGAISPRLGNAAAWLGAHAATWLSQRDFVATPLWYGDQVAGLLVVVEKRLGIYDMRDERRLVMLASIAGVCLQNARLYHQAHQVAALEERDRLSRELHDELAQALGYLKMQASLIERQISAGDRQSAEENLAEVKVVLDSAFSSVREAIFGLRHRIAGGTGFFASLSPFLANYRAAYGLNATLDTALDPLPELAPEVELQVARIVQESLTNVRRHAAAKEVRMSVEREPGSIVVRIADNGKGFDTDAVLKAEGQRYGLQIMRERAETFGGRVQILSTPGRGSEVTIHIPHSQD